MNQHKWERRDRKYERTYPFEPDHVYVAVEEWWVCTRCGCAVRFHTKPKHRRHMRKLGIGTNCDEETVRQVLDA